MKRQHPRRSNLDLEREPLPGGGDGQKFVRLLGRQILGVPRQSQAQAVPVRPNRRELAAGELVAYSRAAEEVVDVDGDRGT